MRKYHAAVDPKNQLLQDDKSAHPRQQKLKQLLARYMEHQWDAFKIVLRETPVGLKRD